MNLNFNSEDLINCLKSAKLPELVHATAFDPQTRVLKVVCMQVNDCLTAIQEEINTLKQYKMYKEEAEELVKHLKGLTDKKLNLESEIKAKEMQLKNVHDELADFLKTRGLDTVDSLKNFFESYDYDREIEMNRSLDEYYSHKNRII